MTRPPAPQPHDEFLPLARITLLGNLLQPGETPDTAVTVVLAKLLCAAAAGKGALEVSKLNLNPDEIDAIRTFSQIFSIEHGLIRLSRYASDTQTVRSFFEERLRAETPRFKNRDVQRELDVILPEEVLKKDGAVIFDNAHQRMAVAALLDAKVGVLTGGPGTGKTTTAAALLALRKRLDPSLKPQDVLVAAPTGKAACRIGESLTKAAQHLQGLTAEEQLFLRQLRALTLHRALEWGPIPPERGGPFRRHALRKLEAKVVLLDEASMVDLNLMHALILALHEETTLLLLGDSDQLESVEVGGILAELVQRSQNASLPQESVEWLSSRLGLPPEQVVSTFESGLSRNSGSPLEALPGLTFGLRHSRRAMGAPWVLELAHLIKPGEVTPFEAIETCFRKYPETLRWHRIANHQTRTELLRPKWSAWMEEARAWTNFTTQPTDTAKVALDKLTEFQLLCSTNQQVDRANAEGIRLLSGNHPTAPGTLPHGCPIIIQVNSHILGLTNGDVGIALGTSMGKPAEIGLFPSPSGPPRFIPLPQLPEYRAAFALTIHKSQGSEWKHVAIELPPSAETGLVSKNLLYTAITRSSGAIDLLGTEAVLRQIAALDEGV